MTRVKVLEKSYLLEDYRDKKYRREMQEKNVLRYHSDGFSSSNELKSSSNKFKVTSKKSGFDSSVDYCSVMIQTDPQCIF